MTKNIFKSSILFHFLKNEIKFQNLCSYLLLIGKRMNTHMFYKPTIEINNVNIEWFSETVKEKYLNFNDILYVDVVLSANQFDYILCVYIFLKNGNHKNNMFCISEEEYVDYVGRFNR